MKANKNRQPTRIIGELLTTVLLVAIVSGCASVGSQVDGGNKETADAYSAVDSGYKNTRRAAGVGQAAVLYTKTAYVDPVIRPVSYFSSISSFVFKSTGGLLNRVSMSTVRMPALQGPVPEVSNALPMDIAAFEELLDNITETRQTKGTIEFLVDGEEYFTRLEEAIDQASESIDIRTYIFDNDDYAMSLAEQLKKRPFLPNL